MKTNTMKIVPVHRFQHLNKHSFLSKCDKHLKKNHCQSLTLPKILVAKVLVKA